MFIVRIWDLPTRFFHWTLACCVLGLIITGQIGGNAMAWHFRFGYAVLTLLFFRVLWGLVGGYWSRWSRLPLGLSSLRAYWQGRSPTLHVAGHNPLGSWSVVAMLCFLALQVSTGLVSDDEIANSGPLSSLVSGTVVALATHWHKNGGKLILFSLVLIHLLALIWYRWRLKQSLVAAMCHGDKTLDESVPASEDGPGRRSLALLLLGLSAMAVAALVNLGD